MASGFRQCAKERENDEIVICEIFKLYQFLSYQEIVIRFCTFQVTRRPREYFGVASLSHGDHSRIKCENYNCVSSALRCLHSYIELAAVDNNLGEL